MSLSASHSAFKYWQIKTLLFYWIIFSDNQNDLNGAELEPGTLQDHFHLISSFLWAPSRKPNSYLSTIDYAVCQGHYN